ncbi:MAG TPA: FGGY-family carbohydrate kinase [Terriglobales bacterium]|nr:FGGY-family carbohydrate kinase [Terriglobales bacterium]
MSLLAVDVGSSACKAVAFNIDGEILARHASGYTPDFPKPSHAEMDPTRFWDAVCSCTQTVARNLTDPVRALCLSSHGETFIPIDRAGEAIAPAILNQDNRAVYETKWIEEQCGRKQLFQTTGLVSHPMYPLPKILWLREHQPDVFSSAARFITVIGYILQRLGLPPYADYSLASRYLAFNVRQRRWAEDILELANLKTDRLPVPMPAGTIAGKLNAAAAAQLGLLSGTKVILGGHDQPSAALGLGVITAGQASDSLGTYECVLVASNSPTLTDTALAGALNSYCHVVPDKFVTIAYFPSGIMVKWFHDLLYGDVAEGSESEHYAILEANAPHKPTGLCITPNLIGTCNPDFNPNTRALIYGLDPGTGRGDIYQGTLEGLACELSHIAQLLSNAVGEFQDVHVSGGGTHSPLGLKLRAALTGKRLHVMQCPEAVSLGGAILAGVAIGEYKTVEEAIHRVVHEVAVIEPDAKVASEYAQQLKQYRCLRSLSPVLSKEEL